MRWCSRSAALSITNRKSTTRFPISLKKKVCYKVSFCENCQRQSCKAFIGLTNRAKMIGWGDPFYLKFWVKLTALERIADFRSIFACSTFYPMFSIRVYLLFRFVLIKLWHRGKSTACIWQLIIPLLNLVLCLFASINLLCVLLSAYYQSAVLHDSLSLLL